MNQTVKKILFGLGALLALIGAYSFTPGATPVAQKLGLFNVGACDPLGTATSTGIFGTDGTVHNYLKDTNVFFISANATSTFECNIGNADVANLNLFFVGSSTSAYPTWTYDFSSDGNAWYTPVLDTAANATTFSGKQNLATTTFAYMSGIAGFEGTTSISASINLSQLPSQLHSRFIRIYLGAGGAAAAVHPELIPRNQN